MLDFTESHKVLEYTSVHVYYTTHWMHMSCVGCGYIVVQQFKNGWSSCSICTLYDLLAVAALYCPQDGHLLFLIMEHHCN
jgi:hypothetical protein